jgi:hypothetical protein
VLSGGWRAVNDARLLLCGQPLQGLEAQLLGSGLAPGFDEVMVAAKSLQIF